MKSSNIIIIILFAFLCSGCEKIFHPEEENISSIKNYDNLLSSAKGVYGLFQQSFYYMNEANIKGDDINIGSSVYETNFNTGNCWKSSYIDRNHYSWEEWNDSHSTGTWEYLYGVILSINNILYQYNITNSSDKPTQELLGEMYLLRAYCYFRLVRTYGEIPVVDDIDVNYSLERAPSIDIYKFIENDLKMAMLLLPSNSLNTRLRNISPHRGTAKAILAELYLNWAGYPINDNSKYSLAAQTAKEVIDSSSFGFGLMEDFGFLWDKNHLFNSESVFSIYYQDPQAYEGTKNLRWESPQYSGFPYAGSCYFTEWDGTFLVPGLNISIGGYPTEIEFYHNYPEGYRKEITFYTNYWIKKNLYYADVDTFYIISVDSINYRFDSTSTCGRASFRKFYYDPYIFDYYYYYPGTDTNEYMEKETGFFGLPRVYIYKYSHTLFTYAEASARSGQLNAEAYEYVNEIRRRARHLNIYSPSQYDLQPGLSAEVFADSVVWERAWENAGELEGRWMDLVRLEKVEDLPRLRDNYEDGPPAYPITKGVYYFPIPSSDIILNPYLGE